LWIVNTVPGRAPPRAATQAGTSPACQSCAWTTSGRQPSKLPSAKRAAIDASSAKRRWLSGQSAPPELVYGLPGRSYSCGATTKYAGTPLIAPLTSATAGAPNAGSSVATGCDCRSAPANAGNAGSNIRTSAPSRFNAGGNAPLTSARPPVFSAG
jgi:hypothetical protein